ncbi:helix-turn-helix transcriptional regulator [Microbacterium sp. ISL-108]|nr:helix-turn-helix transcriptional regulator [Microbacterium sp. ISL-108]
MIHLSASKVFGDSQMPLSAHDVTFLGATERVRVEAVTVAFVTAGATRLRHAGGVADISHGHIVTIPENAWCSSVPHGHVSTVFLHIQRDFLAQQIRWIPRTHPLRRGLEFMHPEDRDPRFLRITATTMDVLRPKLLELTSMTALRDRSLRVLRTAAEIFEDLERYAEHPRNEPRAKASRSGPVRSEVAAALRLLHSDLRRPWSVSDLARAVSLSESQLRRLFRRTVGVGPASFLRSARLESMAALLARGDVTVAEAARASGWASPSAASRAFTQRFGVSPRTFSGARTQP